MAAACALARKQLDAIFLAKCMIRRSGWAGELPRPKAVHFTHADPGYRTEYERIFGTPVVFESWYTYAAGVLSVHYGELKASTIEMGQPEPMARSLLRELVSGIVGL